MEGSRKLSDIFIDRKVARHQRDRIPVVTCGGGVVWIAGAVLSRDFALPKNAERAVRIRLIGPGT